MDDLIGVHECDMRRQYLHTGGHGICRLSDVELQVYLKVLSHVEIAKYALFDT